MSHLGKSMTTKFKFSYEDVFNGLANAIKNVGFSLKSKNFDNGHIVASTGISLFSWGEDINIYITEIDDNNTSVRFSSDLKVSLNFAATNKHEENFHKIIIYLNKYLDEVYYKAQINNKSSFDDARNLSFIYSEFIMIHNLSLNHLKDELNNDDSDKMIDDFFIFLIDKQIKIIATQVDLIEVFVSDIEEIKEELWLISSTISACLLLFMAVHSYSLSKLPKKFLDGLGEGIYLQTITGIYLQKSLENIEKFYGLNNIFDSNNIVDSEMIGIITVMMFDKNAQERFNLKMSKEEFLIGLLSKCNIPKDFAINITKKFDEVLKIEYQRMIKLMMDEEE